MRIFVSKNTAICVSIAFITPFIHVHNADLDALNIKQSPQLTTWITHNNFWSPDTIHRGPVRKGELYHDVICFIDDILIGLILLTVF